MSLPPLTTDRAGLVLTELGVADADAYFELLQASRDHLGPDYAEEVAATRTEILDYFASPDDDNLHYGLRLNGTLIGRIDLNPVKPPHYVLGYWLGAGHVGHGYATAAGRAVAEYARVSLRATDLFAGVTHGNDRSVAVLRRLGFAAVATFDEYTRYQLAL
ncbi:hypothetical protein Lfu02_76490 [Longispora fulva]|uniref:Ribosomal-protein-serine acetyltransferase n=1 Tax=Longispora fulva TaxID=619741 RepID=A0A8J7GGA1_9ACTN|nr:GNAT family N-acetyltransferase [Longispora fulva]MBG6138429.1 ribosomal-protein-serine acetyltransferase [Longispora fulva]GIG63277.1 hypothetical protein Lfu02_76490 [Longispora fulva]